MGIFSKSENKNDKPILVFDIGSSSVGGAILKMKKNQTPRVIFSTREPIILEKEMQADRFLLLTTRALEIVAGRICKTKIGQVENIFCVLSSPWYASQTRIIKFEKNIPFLFTSKLADSLTKKEIGFFEEENNKKLSNTKDKICLIEFKNMKVMLNGYQVSNPFNKKIKKLEMIVSMSMSSHQVLEKMKESLLRHFHSEDIKFSSFGMASFTAVRDIFSEEENFFLIDIAGEMTDISVIKEDVLAESISFPLGRNFMIRKIANKLNCDLNEAKSFISLYKDEHAEKNIEKKLEPIMQKLKTEWLEEFQKSLLSLSKNSSLPSTIFIMADEDLMEFFSKIIKVEQFNQYLLTESKFKIVFLNTQNLHGLVAFNSGVERDPFVILETICLNRLIC